MSLSQEHYGVLGRTFEIKGSRTVKQCDLVVISIGFLMHSIATSVRTDSSNSVFGTWLWSSTEYSSNNARNVNVNNGNVNNNNKSNVNTNNRVRAFVELVSACNLLIVAVLCFFLTVFHIMSIEEILELEKRDKNNVYDIHLYLEGIFWRAYEWSAYLSKIFPSSLSEKERLKPIIRTNKRTNNKVVQVGLQLSSFYKYFPNVIGDDSIFEMNERHIVIHCDKLFGNYDFSNYEETLEDWKFSIKEKTPSKSKNENINKSDVNTLIEEIIAYPIESRSLIENLQFIIHLKDLIMKIK